MLPQLLNSVAEVDLIQKIGNIIILLLKLAKVKQMVKTDDWENIRKFN